MSACESHRQAGWLRLAAMACAGSALATAGWSQSFRLNGELAAELRTGSIAEQHLTADGARLVYRANRAADNQFELFSVPADGSGMSVRLNDPLVPGTSVSFGFQIGAGNRVVYSANVSGTFQIYSVPADASASPTNLSQAVAGIFALDPTGSQVLFVDSVTPTNVFSVPIDGSAAPVLFTTSPKRVTSIRFSPGGSWVTLRTNAFGDVERLFALPSDGSLPPYQLFELPSHLYFGEQRFAPDEAHLVFEVVQIEGIFFPNFLYSVRLDGTAASVLLNQFSSYASGAFELEPTHAQGRLVYFENAAAFSIAYDGTARATLSPPGWTVLYDSFFGAPPLAGIRGPDVVFGATQAGVGALMRAPLDGSQAGAPLFTPGAPTFFTHPEILASGDVVYLADGGLFSVPLAGGTPTWLNPPPSLQAALDFEVHPDGLEAVFRGAGSFAFRDELYAVPLDAASAPRKLNASLASNGDVTSFEISADGLATLYLANVGSRTGAFRTPLSGSGPVVQLNEPFPVSSIGGDVQEFLATPDGTLAVYRADELTDERFELFAVGAELPGLATNLTASLPATESVLTGFALSPSGSGLAFRSQRATEIALYGTPTLGQPPVELDASPLDLSLLLITDDDTRVVYRKSSQAGTEYVLWSAPLDGSSAAIPLHAPLGQARTVLDFRLSPDSQWVAYRADAALDQVFELFVAPLDGSAAPVQLHAPLPPGRSVVDFQFTRDSRSVLFRADLRLAGKVELFLAPRDGSFSPRRLSGKLGDDRHVVDFALSPDGERVLFRSNQLGVSKLDLFSTTLDGGPPRRAADGTPVPPKIVRLSRLQAQNSAAQSYRFSQDGAVVFFLANPANTRGVYRAPADGSAEPVLLSTPLFGTRNVTAFALSPDEEWIVYLADGATDEVYELYRVSTSGGAAVALDPMPPNGDVFEFRIAPDSKHVHYRADRDTDGVFELFAARLDTLQAARRRNPALPVGGRVEADFLPLSGARVLYRADQTTNDVLELFLSLDTKIRRR